MGTNSSVPWTTHSWGLHYGCKKVSTGCDNCYAERDMTRYGKDFYKVTRAKDATFYKPALWHEPAKVFVCPWSDFFILNADEWRPEAWRIIKEHKHLTFQILTKRPERIEKCLPIDWGKGYPNVWLGVTVESIDCLNRINKLAGIPAISKFISAEPLLDDLGGYLRDNPIRLMRTGIEWIIAGCESGQNVRETKIEWVRNLRDFCIKHNIKFFLKQLRKEDGGLVEMPKLDGVIYDQIPER
ncbi:hypothetical protein LCGC14_0608970 [marine sediment metagenome]|uniref:Phage protein Gp37/Gp68 n=1 Tax=marine sediment metagenome TaxID=412755 RepID=A0A0F9RD51_9ZZZZ